MEGWGVKFQYGSMLLMELKLFSTTYFVSQSGHSKSFWQPCLNKTYITFSFKPDFQLICSYMK